MFHGIEALSLTHQKNSNLPVIGYLPMIRRDPDYLISYNLYFRLISFFFFLPNPNHKP
jgi:hypothetical protein